MFNEYKGILPVSNRISFGILTKYLKFKGYRFIEFIHDLGLS